MTITITDPRPAMPDLREIARHLDSQLRANRRPAITDANQLDVQALCVAEEAGELVGAYRRWAGKARRTGTQRELEDEIADVLIVTACFAERAGIDLHAAITRKLAVIYSRGWREEDTPATALPTRREYGPDPDGHDDPCSCPYCATDQWACRACGDAWHGTPPENALCPGGCQPAAQGSAR